MKESSVRPITSQNFASPCLEEASQCVGPSKRCEPNLKIKEPYFLSLDLSIEKLGLIIIDDDLNVILTEEVNFDEDLPEYGTQRGCLINEESSCSPTHMCVKALDILLARISSKVDLEAIRCIGGAAHQNSSVWWSKAAPTLLSRLTPRRSLSEQLLPDQTWTMPNPPNYYDLTTINEAQSLEWLIGGPEELVKRVGCRASCRLTSVQIMKVRQNQRNILEATERISTASAFLATLFIGRLSPPCEGDAAGMGLWNVQERKWDLSLLSLIMCSDFAKAESLNEGLNLMEKLGKPRAESFEPLGSIANYFVRRYGFSADCQVAGFLGHHLAKFMSYPLGPRDAMICWGDSDADSVILPTSLYLPDLTRQILPNPAEFSVGGKEAARVAVLEYKDANLARSFIRESYCNSSWRTFDALVTLIAEGGRVGLDDKLYTFFTPHGELGGLSGISRFEHGQRTEEFRDRRANPRSLLESQLLRMRCHLSRAYQRSNEEIGLSACNEAIIDHPGFDPYHHSALPSRIIITGRNFENRILVELLSSIIGAPVYQCASHFPSNYPASHKDLPLEVTPSMLGAGYKAAWNYNRHLGSTASYSNFLNSKFLLLARLLQDSSVDSQIVTAPKIDASNKMVERPRFSHNFSQVASKIIGNAIIKSSPALNYDANSPPTTSNDSSIHVKANITYPNDAGSVLIKVAEPDEDLFQRYGAQAVEFLRLESFVTRGII
ncbi:hypothetical protein BY996DRAFT_7802906 [Phakopsora pachyrhizi]|nr:hypothetical protein BY996DRAFT_7802906 [Phakopsora pachyrhizi]